MKRLAGRRNASITIYMSLMLILTAALICTLIESARVSALTARLRSVTYMGLDSVFSEYAQPVFEKYGIMLLWCGQEEFSQDAEHYVEENLNCNFFDSLVYTDILAPSFERSELLGHTAPTDMEGDVFRAQVLEYMNYYLVQDAAQRILDNISIFNQGDKVSAFMDKIGKYRDIFTKVEESVGRIKDKINKAKSIARDPASLLNDLAGNLSSFENGDSGAVSEFRNTLNGLRSTGRKLTGYLEEVQAATDRYYGYVEEAQAAVSELENTLAVDRADFDDDVYEVVEEQIIDLKQKSADTDFDYYLVGANRNLTDGYIAKLDRLQRLFDETGETLTEENLPYYTQLVNGYRNDFAGFSLDGLGVNLDTSIIEKEDDGFLSAVSDFFSAGILGFVAGDVSEKSIDISELPSKTSFESAGEAPGENILQASKNKALFGEYILQHFNNASSGDSLSPLSYEVEYILAGKDSDKANLGTVVAEIALIRTGCNLISILKSSQKKAETFALATSLVGCTGMPVVVKIFQILLITAWALAESIADVKALLAGDKVKTVKDDDDWYVSLAGLKNFGSDAISPSGTERGLTYEAYLRLLLLIQNRKKQSFRTMDMIQVNMCSRENEEFRIVDCITGVNFRASYTAPRIFISFPFVNSLINADGGEYRFEIEQGFSY
ncbi:MAG: DUF5702 domain-containing protein [Lachnospiraceae bacterium]|jgi:hypothetical protein